MTNSGELTAIITTSWRGGMVDILPSVVESSIDTEFASWAPGSHKLSGGGNGERSFFRLSTYN